VAHTGNDLADRLGHQRRLILVDVVPAVPGDAVRD
jgi:hypothetical protein